MKILDLFSGIGGFALAGRWAGMETIQFVEIDPFCQKVLAKNFKGVPIHDDIKSFRGERFRGIDILTGGFPCQPYSIAGKRLGTEDDRALWGEMLRVIGEAKPRWIVGENVTGILSMGFDDMLSDLEKEGYETRTFVIPACAVNAPHRRDRVWVVANANEIGRRAGSAQERGTGERLIQQSLENDGDSMGSDVSKFCEAPANANSERELQQEGMLSDERGRISDCRWRNTPPCIRRGDNGLPRKLDSTRRIAALGNAIVPQVAFQILKAIKEVEVMP